MKVSAAHLTSSARSVEESFPLRQMPTLEDVLPAYLGESSTEANVGEGGDTAQMLAMMQTMITKVSKMEKGLKSTSAAFGNRLSELAEGRRGRQASRSQSRATREQQLFGGLEGFENLWKTQSKGNAAQTAEEEDDDNDEDEEELEAPVRGDKRGKHCKASSSGVGDMTTLMNLQMMAMMQKMSKKMGGSDSSGSEGENLGRGGEPDFTGISKMRKKFRTRPETFLQSYTERTKADLGVRDNRQVWRFADNGRRLRPVFGKTSGLHRAMNLFLEVVQLHHDRQPDQACALAIQAAKALHQVAIDKGSWENATLLIPLEEVGERSKFGGDEKELRGIYKYRKSLRDLRTLAQSQKTEEEEADEVVPPKKSDSSQMQ